jgi:hypothetical protein
MKALNFNSIQQPTWPVTLKDKDQTTVNLTAPSVDSVDRLTAMAPELTEAAENKDGRAIRASYELVAELMGCNADGFTFTAEELRDKYQMTFLDLLVFVKGYLEFIAEIKDAKN